MRDEVLADFYARWQDEPLVLDKWFAVQARATRPDLGRDRAGAALSPQILAEEPQPRPRALIGSFVNGNPTGFNRADGAGYEFLASSALQIDRFNPHMAARLLGAFESWRTLEPRRQAPGQELFAAARIEPIVHRQLRNRHKDPGRRLISIIRQSVIN